MGIPSSTAAKKKIFDQTNIFWSWNFLKKKKKAIKKNGFYRK